MKYIEYEDFDPGVGNEYNTALYPRDGIFFNRRMNLSVVITNNTYYTICGKLPAVEMPKTQEIDIAKILAVALHEDTASTYIRRITEDVSPNSRSR